MRSSSRSGGISPNHSLGRRGTHRPGRRLGPARRCRSSRCSTMTLAHNTCSRTTRRRRHRRPCSSRRRGIGKLRRHRLVSHSTGRQRCTDPRTSSSDCRRSRRCTRKWRRSGGGDTGRSSDNARPRQARHWVHSCPHPSPRPWVCRARRRRRSCLRSTRHTRHIGLPDRRSSEGRPSPTHSHRRTRRRHRRRGFRPDHTARRALARWQSRRRFHRSKWACRNNRSRHHSRHRCRRNKRRRQSRTRSRRSRATDRTDRRRCTTRPAGRMRSGPPRRATAGARPAGLRLLRAGCPAVLVASDGALRIELRYQTGGRPSDSPCRGVVNPECRDSSLCC